MTFSFSLIEILAFAGLFQCVSLLVYLIFRAGKFSLAVVPLLFFTDLSLALYLDFSANFFEVENLFLSELRFWLWMFICPLSILFILQVSDLSKPISSLSYVTLFPFLFFTGGAILLRKYVYEEFGEIEFFLLGTIGATLSLPFLWLRSNILSHVRQEPSGKERYWMILSLIGLVIVLISLVYTLLSGYIPQEEFRSVRTVIGLLFVYLAATYLFRIYPPPIKVLTKTVKEDVLSESDEEALRAIDHKLSYEKVYLEPAYSRSDMAQELKMSESILSRLISVRYGRSFPTVLNELRVKEACQLLEQTDAAINVIAEEVGFNSLASFNRVFKDTMGQTASYYRQKKIKEASRLIG